MTSLVRYRYSEPRFSPRISLKRCTRFLISCCLLAIGTTNARAQTHGWYLSGAASYTQTSEKNIDGLINKGPSVSGTVSRIFGSGDLSQELKARVGIAVSKTGYEGKYRSITPEIMLQYTLLKPVTIAEITARVGGFARLHVQDSYYPKLDQGRYYWSNFTGLGIRGEVSKPLNNGSALEFGAELPVAGFISRPEADRFFRIDELSFGNLFKRNFSNLKAATVNRILNPTLWLAVALKQGWIERFGYEFNYLSMKHPVSNDFARLDHRLFLTIKL